MTIAIAGRRFGARAIGFGCLLAVMCLPVPRIFAADLTHSRLVKTHAFVQFGQGAPVEWTPKPFVLRAEVVAASGRTLTSAELRRPGGLASRLSVSGTAAALAASFDLAAELETAYPASATGYALAVTLGGASTQVLPLALGTADFPAAPVLLNLAELDGVHPTGEPFLLRWQPPAAAGRPDFIRVVVEYLTGEETFHTPGPGEVGALEGGRSEVLIPGVALTVPAASAGGAPAFQVRVEFLRVGSLDTTTVPGAIGYSGSLSATTSLVGLGTPVVRKDVSDFGVFQGRAFIQSSPDAAALNPGSPLRFEAGAEGRTLDSLRGAKLRLPGGTAVDLFLDPDNPGYWHRAEAATLVAFDALYAPGTYGFIFETASEGRVEVGLELSRNPADFPPPPLLRDHAKAQSLDPAQAITLGMSSWEGGSGDDHAQLILTTANGALLEATDLWPGRTREESLDLAANRLEYGQTYVCRMRRFKVTGHDTDTYPGAQGWAGLFTETLVLVQTVPSPDRMTVVSPSKQTLPVGAEWIRWLEVEGGVEPLTWTVVQGAPPKGLDFDPAAGRFRGWPGAPGLVLDPEHGLLHGVAREAGSFPFVARVADGSGQVADRGMVLVVPPFEPSPELSISRIETTPIGRLRVLGKVESGTVCTVEGSTDLQEWISLAAGVGLEAGGLELAVPGSDRVLFLRVRRGVVEPDLRPMSATPGRDTNAVTSVVLDAAGGSLSLTNAEGTVLTLKLPAGAVTEASEVRMTLLLGMEGAPLGEGWIGGVHLEPEGLVLREAATLTIQSATPLGTNVVALGYEGEGLDLHEEPAFVSARTLRIPVLHFSGYAAGKPRGIDWDRIARSLGGSCRASSRAQSKIAALLRAAQANQAPDGAVPPGTVAGMEAVFLEWWNETVLPYADAAKRDETMLNQAVNEYLVWAKQMAYILDGLDSTTVNFAPMHRRWRAKVARGALNAINKIHAKAVTEHVFSSAPVQMLAIAKDAFFLDFVEELPGRLEGETIMERIRQFWRFELSMSADLSSVGRDGMVAFSVAMEGGVLGLSSEPGSDDRPMDFGAGSALSDYAAFPLQRTHFRSKSKSGGGYVPVKAVGELRFHHLTFGRDSTADGSSSDPGDSSGCPRQHFKKQRETPPPDKMTLILSFDDPVRAVAGGSPPIDLLINGLKGFHDTEYFRQPSEETLDFFGFREKWLFTWRALVAQAMCGVIAQFFAWMRGGSGAGAFRGLSLRPTPSRGSRRRGTCFVRAGSSRRCGPGIA